MSDTLIIAGAGASAVNFSWPDGVPIMGISSGFHHVPRMDHFCTLDKVMCFPEWVTDSTRWCKHISNWRNAEEWLRLPRVRVWEYATGAEPNFGAEGPIRSGDLRKTNAPDTWHFSMLFAVQLAPRLGFRRLVFIGCDLLGPLVVVSDLLRRWHKPALAAGCEWLNASRISTLCEWMPDYESSDAAAARCSSGHAPSRHSPTAGVWV
jgi:hypothetical protein